MYQSVELDSFAVLGQIIEESLCRVGQGQSHNTGP